MALAAYDHPRIQAALGECSRRNNPYKPPRRISTLRPRRCTSRCFNAISLSIVRTLIPRISAASRLLSAIVSLMGALSFAEDVMVVVLPPQFVAADFAEASLAFAETKIGRASCRER